MVNRKDKIEKVRYDIVQGARRIFVEKGFFGASISQIAKAANISQGLIYHYFDDKVHLWKEVKKDALSRASIDPSFGAAQAKTFHDFLEIVVTNRFKFYGEHPDLLILIGWEKLQSSKDELFGVSGTFEGMWLKEIKQLQEQGEIRNSVDPALLSWLILSAIAGVFDYIPKVYGDEQKESKQREYLSMVIDGLHRAYGCN